MTKNKPLWALSAMRAGRMEVAKDKIEEPAHFCITQDDKNG